MTQRAKFETKSAWLGTEFGEKYARKIFGDDIVDALPRNVRGKNKGKLKQTIVWLKVVEGGWISEGFDHAYEQAVGRVERRVGSTIAWVLRQSTWDGGEIIDSKGDSYLIREI